MKSDIPLPWLEPVDGPRKVAWDALTDFAWAGVANAEGRRWFGRPEVPFGWTLIMGRPGSGKSRMAVEFARALANRKAFGGDRPQRGRFARLSVWWRVQLFISRPRHDDPWDAGWLRPERLSPSIELNDGAYPEWHARVGVEVLLGRLEKWRPRRPTILLLDDPLPGDGKAVIAALRKQANQFLFPVRLVIVNQSAPADILGARDMRSQWHSQVERPLRQPIAFDQGGLTKTDIRKLRASQGILPAGRYPMISRDAQVDRFLNVTKGSPFLVELGFKWLRDGKALAEMTEAKLLTERVDRVVDALCQAGLSKPEHHCAIAAATLAGGAYGGSVARPEDEAFLPARPLIEKAFHLPEGYPAALRRVFPADALDLAQWLPPIRPEMVGDAFVRWVFKQSGPEQQSRLIDTAWLANARGTLRSALRLGRHSDALGVRLAKPPTDLAGLDPLDLALAYADASALIPRSDWDVGENAPAPALAERATQLIRSLPASRAAIAIDSLLRMMALSRDQFITRDVVGCRLVVEAFIAAAAEPTPIAIDQLLTSIEDLALFSTRFQGARQAYFPSNGEECLRKILSASLTSDTSSRVDRAVLCTRLDAFTTRLPIGNPALCALLLNALADVYKTMGGIKSELAAIKELRCSARGASLAGDASAAAAAAHKAENLARAFAGEREFEIECARVWEYVTYAERDHAERCHEMAARVDTIANPFAGDSEFGCLRATAWLAVAISERENAQRCRAIAECVDVIAKPFPGERHFELARAWAWRYVALAERKNVERCRAAVDQVETIAKSSDGERDFAMLRCLAWRCLAWAQLSDNVEQVCAIAELVDVIAKPFAGERDFELERASAWGYVAYAERYNYTRCCAIAERVDSIAMPFDRERDFELKRAMAWRTVIFAERNNSERGRGIAERVDKIAKPFTGEDDFEQERAMAWRYVAYAERNNGERCRAIAERVDDIAKPFAGEREFEFQCAAAWRYVAHAERDNKGRCRTAAERVDAIARPFMGDRRDRSILRLAVAAWVDAIRATPDREERDRLYAERLGITVEEREFGPDNSDIFCAMGKPQYQRKRGFRRARRGG